MRLIKKFSKWCYDLFNPSRREEERDVDFKREFEIYFTHMISRKLHSAADKSLYAIVFKGGSHDIPSVSEKRVFYSNYEEAALRMVELQRVNEKPLEVICVKVYTAYSN